MAALRLSPVFLRLVPRRQLSLSSQKRALFDVTSEEDFRRRVLEAEPPVLVDFHASWCSPCKSLGPKLSLAVGGRTVDLVRVDIDALQELAISYGVAAVPTVLGFREGRVQGQFVGDQSPEFVEDFVKKLVSGGSS